MIDYRQGDVLEQLARLKSEGVKVRTCVTSPPYWGLRDYGTGQWRGGDADCDHNPQRPDGGDRADRTLPLGRGGMYRDVCGKCGAVRVDNQIGLERTPDEYVAKMVQVFRAVRDVLTDDGTLWLNLGDSFAGGKGQSGSRGAEFQEGRNERGDSLNRGYQTLGGAKQTKPTDDRAMLRESGIKPKDLVGIPWRVAFALQADGWYLRSDIIWHKPNPMPESVRDRPTKAHEYIFLLSKSPKYFYDADAVAEPLKAESIKRNQSGWNGNEDRDYVNGKQNHMSKYLGSDKAKAAVSRNRRSVWTVTTKPYKGAHFATFPPDLIEPCILAGSERGDLVLDPFGGSGTTAEVALKHGRRVILVELNPSYVELQKARLGRVQIMGGF